MNIGIDLDFTITEMPEFFAVITKALKDAGHKIHIITYRDVDKAMQTMIELKKLGISFDSVNLPQISDDMASWKRNCATSLDLDLMIDDSPEVLAAMPDKVKRMWLCDPAVFNLNACIDILHNKVPPTHRPFPVAAQNHFISF